MKLSELRLNMEEIIIDYDIKKGERHAQLVRPHKNRVKTTIEKKIPEAKFKQILGKLPQETEFVAISCGKNEKKTLFGILEDDTRFSYSYPERHPQMSFFRNYEFDIPFLVKMLETIWVRPDRIDFQFDPIRVQADDPVRNFSYFTAPHECDDEQDHYCKLERLEPEQFDLVNGIGEVFPYMQKEMMSIKSKLPADIVSELDFRTKSRLGNRYSTQIRAYMRYDAHFKRSDDESGSNLYVKDVLEILNIMQHELTGKIIDYNFSDVSA